MSNIGGQRDDYQNTTDKAKKDYFFIGANSEGFLGGIFRRQGKSLKSFMNVIENPDYEIKFRFFDIAQDYALIALPEEAEIVINQILNEIRP